MEPHSARDAVLDFFTAVLSERPAEVIAAVGGGPAFLGFELTGVDGAPDACWTLVVEPPAVQVMDGVDARATSTVRTSRAGFDALLASPGRFMHLLMVGELQVRGDQGLAHRVVQLAAIGHCAAPPAVHAASSGAARAFTLRDPSALVPTGVRDLDRVDLRPCLLQALFGPPGPPAGRRSSGAYRFTDAAGVCVDIHDHDLTHEATGSTEQRPAAALWSSTESWMFEVAASDPAALPDFFRWLTARIEAHAAALVAQSVEACRTLAARGDRKEAQRALWRAWEQVASDPKLRGALARALDDARAELRALAP